MGCHALLQGIFPAQGSNVGLPHCRWIFYHLSHQGSYFIHNNFTATPRLLFDWMTGDYSPAQLTQPKTSQLMWSLFPCQPLTHIDPHIDGWIFLTGKWQERTAVRTYYKTRSHGCKVWLHLSLSQNVIQSDQYLGNLMYSWLWLLIFNYYPWIMKNTT